MSTICICDCDIIKVIVTSHKVDRLLLLPIHVVCFCKQINVKKVGVALMLVKNECPTQLVIVL